VTGTIGDRLLVTMGADRPPGAMGLEELLAPARSALKVAQKTAGDLAIVGYTSGTSGRLSGGGHERRESSWLRL
jgi:acyl-coenzyme A synthetase/AMP-(fatty) acid ligase